MDHEDEAALWELLEHAIGNGADTKAFQSCVDVLAACAGSERGVLALSEGQRQRLNALLADGQGSSGPVDEPPLADFLGRVLTSGHELFVGDVTEDPVFAGENFDDAWSPVRAFAAIPVRSTDGEQIALVFLSNSEPREFSADDISLLRVAARCIGGHLDVWILSLRLAVASRRLLDEQRRARNEERARRETTLLLVHDLKNPLAVISIAAEAAMDKAKPSVRMALDDIMAAHEVAQHLVTDMLDLAKTEVGGLRFQSKKVDLHALVDGTAGRLALFAQHHRHSIRVECKARDSVVRGDAFLLERLVRNLIDNAVKYAPAGTAVSVVIADAGNQVSLRVEDEGATIDAALSALIFEEDTRVLSANRGSHGLGLKFCKAVAEVHGGSIRVEARAVTGGNAFCVELPRP